MQRTCPTILLSFLLAAVLSSCGSLRRPGFSNSNSGTYVWAPGSARYGNSDSVQFFIKVMELAGDLRLYMPVTGAYVLLDGKRFDMDPADQTIHISTTPGRHVLEAFGSLKHYSVPVRGFSYESRGDYHFTFFLAPKTLGSSGTL
jgi:hypothetical protein